MEFPSIIDPSVHRYDGPNIHAEGAICILRGDVGVSGVIYFYQLPNDNGGLRITGAVKGLSPGKHGMHIHEYGDNTYGCVSAGEHFDSSGRVYVHGDRLDKERHTGDLGNIVADYQGTAIIDMIDYVISLSGPNNILGRSMVIHAKEDDLGRQHTQASKKNGDSGSRVACGVIGRCVLASNP